MSPERAQRGPARSEAGSLLIELMVAISILGVGLLVLVQQQSIGLHETRTTANRIFAWQKAKALLTEIQNGVQRGEIANGNDLLDLADSAENPVLTTLRGKNGALLAPDHRMSGNVKHLDQWLWSRIIEVEETPALPDMKYVRVSVERRSSNGAWAKKATIGSLLSLAAAPFVPRRVYDVYVLACAETPALWSTLSDARKELEDSLATIEDHEAVKFRLRWITTLGYGRDPLYVPYVNTLREATAEAPWAYWYPGKLDTTAHLYDARAFTGRIRIDTTIQNGWSAADTAPHAIADQFNHCMRAPAARALQARRIAAKLETADEPSLRLLLDDMAADPAKFSNALFVNLHGAGMPVPPLRNYSDAAKDPAGRPGIRVVTHPALLRTPRDPNLDGNHSDSSSAEFRVYAYKTDPTAGPDVLAEPITLVIPGNDLTSLLRVRRLQGGIANARYRSFDSNEGKPPRRGTAKPTEMSFESGYVATPTSYTWIKLYNTPLTAPVVEGAGLPPSQRLYGLEYVPSPVRAGESFATDLATKGDGPKNTARWRIRIRPDAVPTGAGGDRLVTVVTRIGDNLETGTAGPTPVQPANISTTYTWWASSPAAVPFTERCQIQGDPRLNPYADLSKGGTTSPDGYNAYFQDLVSAGTDVRSEWPTLDRTKLRDGSGEGIPVDGPRLLAMIRERLLGSGAILINPQGKARTLLLGGEIARSGTGGEPAAVRVHGDFAGAGQSVLVNTMAGATLAESIAGAQTVRDALGTFWCKPWLGELYPDSVWADWLANGNLATPDFERVPFASAQLGVVAPGTSFDFATGATLDVQASAALAETLPYATLAASGSEIYALAATSPAAHAFVSVVPESVASGQPTLAARSLTAAVETFGRLGLDQTPGRIVQLPWIQIAEPLEGSLADDPRSILLRWKTEFGHGAVDTSKIVNEAEDDFVYSLLYSRDDGQSWRRVGNHAAAQAGVRPDLEFLVEDAATGPESFLIQTPIASFPAGRYVFRVEAYHKTRRLHYAYHQVRVTLRRQ